jgi:hypothetical protein
VETSGKADAGCDTANTLLIENEEMSASNIVELSAIP